MERTIRDIQSRQVIWWVFLYRDSYRMKEGVLSLILLKTSHGMLLSPRDGTVPVTSVERIVKDHAIHYQALTLVGASIYPYCRGVYCSLLRLARDCGGTRGIILINSAGVSSSTANNYPECLSARGMLATNTYPRHSRPSGSFATTLNYYPRPKLPLKAQFKSKFASQLTNIDADRSDRFKRSKTRFAY